MAATKIHFDDDAIRPSHPISTDPSIGEGIVFSRTISRDDGDQRKKTDDANSESGELPSDHRTKQVFKGRNLVYLAYQSIGVIYGDIGTSPLYVFSSTFTSEPTKDDLIGILSLIIWSLLMMVTLKYVCIVLRADNEGEGGTFSCYSLLSRYAHVANIDPKEAQLMRIQRVKTGEMPAVNLSVRSRIEHSKFLRGLLKVIGVLAVSLVMSDGVLTPAQSVLGAYQGLNVAASVDTSVVVGATCGTLVLLFLIQPFGTTKIASAFAPIVIIWLGLLGFMGLYNLIMHDWTVLKAFNPAEGFLFLIRHGEEGWKRLGGVILAFTGVEALFADLGAFSMRAIQISWLCWCLPMLLLTYTGQAAYISENPGAYVYPVFYTAPKGMLIPTLVFAVLAAIVASQAIITATFQLIAQITKLSYFPAIKVLHTSKVFHNQLYVPAVNWLLMIGTVIVTAVYNNTTSLGNAYGVCVIMVTFFDTCMVTLVALIVWTLPWYWAILPAATILCMDGAFLSSALLKVPDGAWFTITLAAVLACVFILWRFGKEQQWASEATDRVALSHFVSKGDDGSLSLVKYDGERISSSQGFGIFFDKIGDGSTPMVFSQFIGKLASIPETSVFLHLRAVERPTVPDSERYFVFQLSLPNCYRLVIRHGYMDEVITHDLAAVVLAQVRQHIMRVQRSRDLDTVFEEDFPIWKQERMAEETSASAELPKAPSESIAGGGDDTTKDSLSVAETAFSHRVLYIVGKEEMKIQPASPLWRKLLLSAFLFIRHNSRNKVANLQLPTAKLVEIGFVKNI